jgi:hypothetical protein
MRRRLVSSGKENATVKPSRILPQIGRQDGDARVLFHLLQQVGHLEIGVAVS